jgi:hypothetical protein
VATSEVIITIPSVIAQSLPRPTYVSVWLSFLLKEQPNRSNNEEAISDDLFWWSAALGRGRRKETQTLKTGLCYMLHRAEILYSEHSFDLGINLL